MQPDRRPADGVNITMTLVQRGNAPVSRRRTIEQPPKTEANEKADDESGTWIRHGWEEYTSEDYLNLLNAVSPDP